METPALHAKKILFYTLLALFAFAANSLFCRMALGKALIDGTSFTLIRLLSGSITLVVITLLFKKSTWQSVPMDYRAAGFLFLYAITFSFAYGYLSTGTGALILFGSVQATMIGVALWRGERPHPIEWVGLILALTGLVYLVFPSLNAPPLTGSLLMAVAGIAWGGYSLRGRGVHHPITATTKNFIGTLPLALLISLLMWQSAHYSLQGIILAILSGALASGVGYAIWYTALTGLTATRAATVQLSVPIIAALAGVIFLGEILSLHLIIASFLILGGIGLAVFARKL
ncbi:putative permease, DMT superfamily [Beggiatoa alba B18LD]|uniref:Putative permease, DMT superfamily n=2 Tax=Beggiatoa alba TaxID=1022 RepID=I3CJI2_9GAMM|nr:putative permease, DMT superfamily [Beggiatoa alba B18LD]